MRTNLVLGPAEAVLANFTVLVLGSAAAIGLLSLFVLFNREYSTPFVFMVAVVTFLFIAISPKVYLDYRRSKKHVRPKPSKKGG